MKEEQTKERRGKLLFTDNIVFNANVTHIVNVSRYMNVYWMVLAANKKVTDLKKEIQRMGEEQTEQNRGK